MSTPNAPKGIMAIYGCGGTGLNIARHFDGLETESHMAAYDVSYIDTSRANSKGLPSVDRLTLAGDDNTDGAGKVRARNAPAILEAVPEHLAANPPGDFNIVIYSADGGTGNVAGTTIHRYLIERGVSVISIVVGSTLSVQSIINTKKTLQTLSSISVSTESNVNVLYTQNENSVTRTEIDRVIQAAIELFAVLGSRQNDELDKEDIFNWLNYNRVLNTENTVNCIDILHDEDVGEGEVISVVSLAPEKDFARPDWLPLYETAGYCDFDNIPHLKQTKSVHFSIDPNGMASIYKKIDSNSSELSERLANRKRVGTFIDENTEIGDGGLVF
jgi:hypothetical protein